MCFAPQRRALFRYLNFQSCLKPSVFNTFDLRHSGVHFFDVSTSKGFKNKGHRHLMGRSNPVFIGSGVRFFHWLHGWRSNVPFSYIGETRIASLCVVGSDIACYMNCLLLSGALLETRVFSWTVGECTVERHHPDLDSKPCPLAAGNCVTTMPSAYHWRTNSRVTAHQSISALDLPIRWELS